MYSANINRRPRSFIDIAVQVLRLKIYPRSEIFLEGKEEKEVEKDEAEAIVRLRWAEECTARTRWVMLVGYGGQRKHQEIS